MWPVDRWRNAVLSKDGPRDPSTRLMLMTLSMHMDPDGTNAWPSQKTLATRTGLTRRTVQRHLRLAEHDGWIARGRGPKHGRNWRLTSYQACLPEGVEGGVTVAPPVENVASPATERGVIDDKGGATGATVPLTPTSSIPKKRNALKSAPGREARKEARGYQERTGPVTPDELARCREAGAHTPYEISKYLRVGVHEAEVALKLETTAAMDRITARAATA